jgi:starch-binding outer membrane protein, SusD/RagB family
MKKYKNKLSLLLTAVVCTLFVLACTKALQPKELSELTPQNFYQSAADANAALITLYVPFTSNWGNDDPGTSGPTWYAGLYNADPKTYYARSMINTDEITNTAQDATTGPLENYTWGPSTWVGPNDPNYYKVSYVAKATDIMSAINASSAVPAATKTAYIAEAQALRGWLMWVLYDFYGPVNVKVSESTLSDTAETPRLSDTAYVNQMINDLTTAIPNLQASYNNDAANWGRISQGVANMVLLKIYMRKKEWAQAQAQAQTIMNMGAYSLVTTPLIAGQTAYQSIFNTSANKEIIYAVPANLTSPNFWPQEVLPSDYASAPGIAAEASGWLVQYMPWAFYDKYDPTDQRLSTILTSYTNTSGVVRNQANGMPGACPLKYTNLTTNNEATSQDVVVFRYADVVLSMAEAINEQAGPANAYPYINQIRERAGVSDLSGLTQATMRQAILDERGRELYGEGVRRQDLLRNGSYISTAIAMGRQAQPYDTLFPIPQAIIVQGEGIIAQNPGY